MSESDRPVWFAGDLADPLAAAIVQALAPLRPRLIPCPGDLPSAWPSLEAAASRIVVVHRSTLGATDAGHLAKLRGRLDSGSLIVLAVGPQARYADIDRWGSLVDLVLPEALAAETIARHVGIVEARSSLAHGRDVAVVSTSPELRSTWGAILRASGYDVAEFVQLEMAPPGQPTVWDVPVLEPSWADRLQARSRGGSVVAAIGFLDRITREQARRAGATSCLDMPADLLDLVHAIDRITGLRRDPAHPAIPSPALPRHPARERTAN